MAFLLGFIFIFASFSSIGQTKKVVPIRQKAKLSIHKSYSTAWSKKKIVHQPKKEVNSSKIVHQHRKRTSADFKNYYGRYAFFKDNYKNMNAVVIPIDVHIWQKDDGTGNYIDTSLNRKTMQQTIVDMNRFYTHIEPSSHPLPWVHDYSTTKIHFVLMHIYYDKSTICWQKGRGGYQEGVFLNKKANELHPEGKHYFKIHIVSDQSRNGGYGTFPTYELKHEHFIISSNPSGETVYENIGRAWPGAMHFAHEMGHNLNLYHNYSYNFDACNQKNPDYLDDVFGRGKNAICPQDAGWDCDIHDPNKSCTNNIMGGTKDSRYFSPKQVQRMHRALAQKSIGKYAIPYQFDDKKYITIDSNATWDFDMRLFTNLRIRKGDTLIIKDTLRMATQAKIKIDPGGVLIIDGGKITSSRFFGNHQAWRGIECKEKDKSTCLLMLNGGKIENVLSPHSKEK